jgi:hypothetical protein
MKYTPKPGTVKLVFADGTVIPIEDTNFKLCTAEDIQDYVSSKSWLRPWPVYTVGELFRQYLIIEGVPEALDRPKT